MNRIRLSALLLGTVLVSACGFSSGLPGDTQGKDLSPAENKAFCEASEEYYADQISEEDSKKMACLFGGFIAGAFSPDNAVATCTSAFDDCMAKPAETSENQGSSCEGTGSTPGCTATVAEMEDCVVEHADALSEFIDTASCENMTDEGSTEPEVGPACKIIEDKGCSLP